MALDYSRAAESFKQKMIAAFGAVDEVNFNKFSKALMEAAIEEITTNAEAKVTVNYKDGQGEPTEDVDRSVDATGTVE